MQLTLMIQTTDLDYYFQCFPHVQVQDTVLAALDGTDRIMKFVFLQDPTERHNSISIFLQQTGFDENMKACTASL